ncbi:phospholipase ABHD3-like isoform X1 [Girardinichthys multiradiatus]|uniref:phospholipase ABHD3-like isoform X1 n=1 Tax=Girardinichthys multiradiatus TaxID=208333 RepID=UPI001FABC67D|nr:phospholipase ABHD3-like isoform X1 [Girardinichthys multiradiatus]XP_047244660.1 phospholipase ABHD3-like isoform X1 [Girardinichthys multiradiatus]
MYLSSVELWRTYWECVSRPYTVFICSFTAALYYLWGRKCQTPALICSEAFSAFLHKHCPVVAERFCPTPWCWGGRLQTLVCAFLKSRPLVSYRNELIRTVDGGQISLDWVDNHISETYPESCTRPTVLILPGLTGNSQQSYVLHAVSQATRRGYRCVVFNNRGVGGEELLTPVTYCAANTSDLERVVQHVKGLFPQAPVLGAGVSLGGMILLNYLARKRTESGMVAGITISVAWDALKSSNSMEEPLNWLLFNKHLTHGLRQKVTRHRKILEKVVDVDYVLKARTIREFDERFTSHLFGYKTCIDYYRDASPAKKLPQTSVPILCLNAADDPFSPQSAIPVSIVQALPNVALLLTAHGGHIAFLQGLFPRGESYMECLFGQFVQAVFEHPGDIKKACGVDKDEPNKYQSDREE